MEIRVRGSPVAMSQQLDPVEVSPPYDIVALMATNALRTHIGVLDLRAR